VAAAEPLTPPPGEAADGAARPVALLALLVALVVLEHVRAWLGDAGFEHFEEIGRELRAWSAGEVRASSLVTGGGVLHPGLWWVSARVGVPWWGTQPVHALLDLAGLLGFWFLAPRSLPRAAVWGTALLIAADPLLKVFLFENSAASVAVTPPLVALLLGPPLRGRRLVAAAVLLVVVLDLSLVVAPAVFAFGWLIAQQRGRRPVGFLVAVIGLALLPLAIAISDPEPWLRVLEAGGGASGFQFGLVLEFLLWPSTLLAAVGFALGAHRLLPRATLQALAIWLVPCVAFVLFPLGPGDRYHLAGAVAPLAILGGLTLDRVLGRWDRAVPVLVVAAVVLSALATVHTARAPTWRGEDGPVRCAAMDAGVCAPRDLRQVVDALGAAGWTPEEQLDLTFVGSLSRCLAPVWDWEAITQGAVRRPSTETRVVLLDDLPPELSVGGAPILEGLTAWDGMPPEDWGGLFYVEFEPGEEPEFDAVLTRTCPELECRQHSREKDGGTWMLTRRRPEIAEDEVVELVRLRPTHRPAPSQR